jgi:hypothetical protein
MTSKRITTSDCDIHVWRGPGETWMVAQGERPLASAHYRLQAHAVAFARAFALSAHSELVIHDPGGRSRRLPRASLSYPTRLD